MLSAGEAAVLAGSSALVSALLGLDLWYAVIGGYGAAAVRRRLVAVAAAAVPSLTLLLGLGWAHPPRPPWGPQSIGAQLAQAVSLALLPTELLLLLGGLGLAATGARAGWGTLLGAMLTTLALGAQTFFAALVAGQLLTGVSL